jgi:signal transduction histidine kinase
LARRKVLLQLALAAKLPRLQADRIQLQQVLLNLMVNALDSLSGVADRVLHIRTEYQAPDTVRVAVKDTGIGVDREQSERLFQAFFTTKPQGLGMGLAISRSIIEAHGGRLWMSPNDGPGVTFQFTLPIQNGDAT